MLTASSQGKAVRAVTDVAEEGSFSPPLTPGLQASLQDRLSERKGRSFATRLDPAVVAPALCGGQLSARAGLQVPWVGLHPGELPRWCICCEAVFRTHRGRRWGGARFPDTQILHSLAQNALQEEAGPVTVMLVAIYRQRF